MARAYMKLDGNLTPISLDTVSPKFLFYGGLSPRTVVKANLGDLSTVNTSVSYGSDIKSIATDDTYVYVCGGSTVKKYLKSDLSYVGETPSGASGNTMAIDDTHIYIGGYGKIVKKYLKSDLSYIGETPDYGGSIFSMAIDETFVYVGGGPTPYRVRKYFKSD